MDDRNSVPYTEYMLFFIEGLHIHGLAHAASGYHKVLLENRKLYNQVQDLKGTKLIITVLQICLFSAFKII